MHPLWFHNWFAQDINAQILPFELCVQPRRVVEYKFLFYFITSTSTGVYIVLHAIN